MSEIVMQVIETEEGLRYQIAERLSKLTAEQLIRFIGEVEALLSQE